jgi:hypothetical protein
VIEQSTRKLGVEIEISSAPEPPRGFGQSLQDMELDRAWMPHGGAACPLAEGEGGDVIPLGVVTAPLGAAFEADAGVESQSEVCAFGPLNSAQIKFRRCASAWTAGLLVWFRSVGSRALFASRPVGARRSAARP